MGAGKAAAFTFDLAKSIIYTRQGNPAWSGDERDGQPPIRSDDLFFGGKVGDVQPDWVNLDKVSIPQADEQQRLLANLIQHMNRDRKPLPRFWYFPFGKRAVVVMTSDNHGNGGWGAFRLDRQLALDPPGCDVSRWECVRSSMYLYLSPFNTASYQAQGFELGLHVTTNCENYTPATLEAFFTQQLDAFAAFPQFAGLNAPATNRTHCIVWSDWVTHAKVELQHGIRFDTNYYYWPDSWLQNRPGHFTGSAMPMRFADLDGTMIDVFQAATQITDESGQQQPFTINSLLDRALGAEGYYAAVTANMHSDNGDETLHDIIVASAQARAVPVVSSRQMLGWLDGRNGSSFENITWTNDILSFGVAVGAGANGLQAMVPTRAAGDKSLAALSRNGTPVTYALQVVKGVEYAAFVAEPGTLPGDVCARRRRPGHFRRLRERHLRRHRHHPVADQRERHHGDAVRHRSREPEPDRLRAQLPDQPQPRTQRTDRRRDVPLQGHVRGSVGEQRVVGGPQLRGHRRHGGPGGQPGASQRRRTGVHGNSLRPAVDGHGQRRRHRRGRRLLFGWRRQLRRDLRVHGVAGHGAHLHLAGSRSGEHDRPHPRHRP